MIDNDVTREANWVEMPFRPRPEQDGRHPMRLIRIGVALLMLSAGVLLVPGAGPADAHCRGTGYQPGYQFFAWGRGTEAARFNANTCDGDGIYRGQVAELPDSDNDGVCAVARWKPSGKNWVWSGYSCNQSWRNYTLWAGSGELKVCDGWNSNACSTGFLWSWGM